MNDKEKEFLEKFKSNKISSRDIEKGREKASKLGDLAGEFLTLISMVKDTLSGNFELKPTEIATIIGAIIYVVSPLDAVPDLIPMAGFIDDATVVGVVVNQVSNAIKRYKQKK